MKTVILTLLFLFPFLVDAQSIDSLKREIDVTKNNSEKIKLYNQLALKLADEGLSKEALQVYQKVLKLCKTPKEFASTYNEIGNIHSDLGENDDALKTYQQALNTIDDEDLKLNAIINKNIGALFLSWKKLDDALKYYIKAEELAIRAKDDRTIADLANNKGTVYEQQNQFKKADFNYKKALAYYLQQKYYDRISLTYNNLAILAKVQKQVILAANYYQKSVDYAKMANNKWLSAAVGNNLGNLLSEMKAYQKSDISLKAALALEKEIDAKELIQETLENLADNEKRRGNYQLAFSYLKQAAEAKSNFINLENTKEVAKLKEQFDAANKEKKIELLNKESKIQRLTLTKKNNTILALLGLFIGIFIISFLIFRSYRQKQIARLKLTTAETKNQMQEEKLRISRELHDNIGAQLSFINGSIQSMANADSKNEQLQQTQQVTQNTIKELRSTVWLINQQEFGLEEFVVKLREYLKPYYGGKLVIAIENQSDKDYNIESIIATNLFRIIQELVNNAIKHSEANKLEVNLIAEQNKLKVSVKDDGKGYDINARPAGYGLKNIQARVKTINATCTINTAISSGTETYLSIPI